MVSGDDKSDFLRPIGVASSSPSASYLFAFVYSLRILESREVDGSRARDSLLNDEKQQQQQQWEIENG